MGLNSSKVTPDDDVDDDDHWSGKSRELEYEEPLPPLELEKLFTVHMDALRSAMILFNARAGGDDAKKYEDMIREQTTERLRKWIEVNQSRSRALCGEKLAGLHASSIMTRSGNDASAYTDIASIRFDIKTLATQVTRNSARLCDNTARCACVT